MDTYSYYDSKTETFNGYRRTVNSVFLMYLVYIFMSFVQGVLPRASDILGMLLGEYASEISSVIFAELDGILTSFLIVGVPAVVLKLITGEKGLFTLTVKDTDPERPMYPNRRYIFANIIPFTFALIVISSTMSLLAGLCGWMRFDEAAEMPAKNDMFGIVLMIVSTAAVPAFLEELLFRGAVLRLLLPYGKMPAILLSSVFFGSFHGAGVNIAYTTASGLIFAVTAMESGSLIPSMIMHFLNNSVVFIEQIWGIYFPDSLPVFEAVEPLLRFGLGAAAIVWLFGQKSRLFPGRKREEDGILSGRELIKGAFTPVTVVYAIVVVCMSLIYRIIL